MFTRSWPRYLYQYWYSSPLPRDPSGADQFIDLCLYSWTLCRYLEFNTKWQKWLWKCRCYTYTVQTSWVIVIISYGQAIYIHNARFEYSYCHAVINKDCKHLEEYSVMSHCHIVKATQNWSIMAASRGNCRRSLVTEARNKYCGVVRGSCSTYDYIYKHLSIGPNYRGFHDVKVEFVQFNLLHLRPGCHYTPVGHHGRPKTSYSGLVHMADWTN